MTNALAGSSPINLVCVAHAKNIRIAVARLAIVADDNSAIR